MSEISEWFKEKNYEAGVQIYANSPGAKSRVVTQLQRGKNNRNLTTLIRELRLLKKKQSAPVKEKPVIRKPKIEKAPTVSATEKVQHNQVREESAKKYFGKIKYGDLPEALRPRFKLLKDIFYEMQDLKFSLNKVPAKDKKTALAIIIQIDSLDEQRQLIWQEIDHWEKHKTLLPTKTEDDFSKMSPQQLFLKKANIASSISKMQKRITGWQESLDGETDKHEIQKTLQQINNTKQKLHRHELNLKKIERLL